MSDKNNNVLKKIAPKSSQMTKSKQDSNKSKVTGNKSNRTRKYKSENEATSLSSRIKLFIKILAIAFVVINALAPIVIYSWPNIMSHMIFQQFSKP